MNPIVKTIYHLMLKEMFITDTQSNQTYIMSDDPDVLAILQNAAIPFAQNPLRVNQQSMVNSLVGRLKEYA